MRRFLLIAALGGVTGTAAAQSSRWVTLQKATRVTLLLDTSSVVRESQGTAVVWVKWQYQKPSKLAPEDAYITAYTMRRLVVECGATRERVFRAVSYSPDGATFHSFDLPVEQADWVAPVPESIGEAEVRGLCAWLAKSP